MSLPRRGRPLDDADYRRLLGFRSELRGFIRWSEEAAREEGLTPALHQLLLVVRGHHDPEGPTVGEVAHELQIRHHSAVELAQRAEGIGLLQRERDPRDQRLHRLRLTASGEQRLETVTRLHLPRIAALAAALEQVVDSPARRGRTVAEVGGAAGRDGAA